MPGAVNSDDGVYYVVAVTSNGSATGATVWRQGFNASTDAQHAISQVGGDGQLRVVRAKDPWEAARRALDTLDKERPGQ